jgi:hypothetical protein
MNIANEQKVIKNKVYLLRLAAPKCIQSLQGHGFQPG